MPDINWDCFLGGWTKIQGGVSAERSPFPVAEDVDRERPLRAIIHLQPCYDTGWHGEVTVNVLRSIERNRKVAALVRGHINIP